MIDNY
ncbi:hypothetical protein YPPY66_1604, partial [Yersinia pestis PY-66]|jgi:hypothetical protein